MSGIIGGAGSKSGVIGTTELDYESGDWTPTFISVSGCFTSTGIASYSGCSYTKIGNLVTVQGYLVGTGSCTNAEGIYRIDGLPFPARFANYGQGSAQLYNSHGSSDSEILVVGTNAGTHCYMYRGTVNGTTSLTFYLGLTYET